jgi:hypothetical protein
VSSSTGAMPGRDGSTPASWERRHESAIGARTEGESPAWMNLSQAARSSRARSGGAVLASIASQGFSTLVDPLVG